MDFRKEPAPIIHRLKPKELGERSFKKIQGLLINLHANPGFINTMVGASDEKNDVEVISDESGKRTSVWFDYGDFKYHFLYSTGTIQVDEQIVKNEDFSMSRYPKDSFDSSNVASSPCTSFDLQASYYKDGNKIIGVAGNIVIAGDKIGEERYGSLEAYSRIHELFGEIFPKPLDL